MVPAMAATAIRRSTPFGLALLLAACVAPSTPPPAPRPAPAPIPTPTPTPTPSVARGPDWRDWPVTPGDWHYQRDGAVTEARFGEAAAAPVLVLRCEGGQVRLLRAVPSGASGPLRIRTTTGDVARAAQLSGTMLESVFPARDPTLDDLAYSRGRFMLMANNAPDLIVPAWPEVTRVIEDCRA